MRNWVALGAVLGALAVACGAFGAHAIRERIEPADYEIWQTAVLYHLVHAPALILYGLFARGSAARGAPGWCFMLGTLVFSGTLYAIALGGPRWLGAITPVGGLLLIAGWTWLAREAARQSG